MKSIRIIHPAEIALHKMTPRLEPLKVGEYVHLYDITGVVTGIKKKVTKKGDWSCFRGDFEAITPEGDVFISHSLMIEAPAKGELLAKIELAQKDHWELRLGFTARVRLVAPINPGVLIGFEVDTYFVCGPRNQWKELRNEALACDCLTIGSDE